MGNDPFSNGYAAGIEGAGQCPHLTFSPAWLLWHAGEAVGHQVACAQLEFIFQNFPQD